MGEEPPFKLCFPNCKDWWAMYADGKLVGSCKRAWGAGSCSKSPANKRRKSK